MRQFIDCPRDHSLGSPRDQNPYSDLPLGGGKSFPDLNIIICRNPKILTGGPHPDCLRHNAKHQLHFQRP